MVQVEQDCGRDRQAMLLVAGGLDGRFRHIAWVGEGVGGQGCSMAVQIEHVSSISDSQEQQPTEVEIAGHEEGITQVVMGGGGKKAMTAMQ